MNLKIEKGITITALVITVVLMLILAGVTIHFGGNAVERARLEDIKTDKITIQTKAKIIKEQKEFNDIDTLVGSTISEEEARIINVENNENVLKWSSQDLEAQGLSTIEGDKYVVDYNNDCEVYFLEGYNGEYSLSSLQDE